MKISDGQTEGNRPDIDGLFLWNMAAASGNTGFHMPGHAGARFFPEEYTRRILRTDVTELSSTDDLHHPEGPVLLAQKEASRIYESALSVFITTGSTTGIRTLIGSVRTDDSFFLLPRSVHMSVLYSLMLLRIPYAFLPVSQSELTDSDILLPQTTADAVCRGLAEYPQTTDVLIVSPDYYGRTAPVCEIATAVHSLGCRLLVDEAHGAHIRFCPDPHPDDAMHCGADLSVMSLHKTMPALTMASMLHVSLSAVQSGRVHPENILRMLRVFETSSPSFAVAASAEYAIAWAVCEGRERISAVLSETKNFLCRIQSLGTLRPLFRENGKNDPLRLVLLVEKDGISAISVARYLADQKIDIEFADLRRLVCILSPFQTHADFENLADALERFFADDPAKEAYHLSDGKDWIEIERKWKDRTVQYQIDCPMEEAFWIRKGERTRLSHAAGMTASDPIIPYPPGVPLIWPGERINRDHIFIIQTLLDCGISVTGMEDGCLNVTGKPVQADQIDKNTGGDE